MYELCGHPCTHSTGKCVRPLRAPRLPVGGPARALERDLRHARILLRVGRRIQEVRLVTAPVSELEAQLTILNLDQIGVYLSARTIVTRDYTGDLGLLLERSADPHAHVTAGPKPAAAGGVVDFDRHRPHAEDLARFPDPRELLFGRSAEPA